MPCIHCSLNWTMLCVRIHNTRLLQSKVTPRSHSPVTVTERPVGMRQKEGCIQNYMGTTYKQGVLYRYDHYSEDCNQGHKSLRHQSQENKQQTFNTAIKTQIAPLQTYFSIYLQQSDLCMKRRRVGEVSNYFSGQKLSP